MICFLDKSPLKRARVKTPFGEGVAYVVEGQPLEPGLYLLPDPVEPAPVIGPANVAFAFFAQDGHLIFLGSLLTSASA